MVTIKARRGKIAKFEQTFQDRNLAKEKQKTLKDNGWDNILWIEQPNHCEAKVHKILNHHNFQKENTK